MLYTFICVGIDELLPKFISRQLATVLLYCIAGKFGRELNLAVWRSHFTIAKLKSTKISSVRAYVCMAIPYQTAKLKSANIIVMPVWEQTAKFNSRQYFWLYGTLFLTCITVKISCCWLQLCYFVSHTYSSLHTVGMYFCFAKLTDHNIFIILYGITSVYFAVSPAIKYNIITKSLLTSHTCSFQD